MPLRAFGPVVADALMLFVTEMSRQLTLERRLDDQPGQLREQPALTINRDALSLRVTDQPRHQRPVHDQRRNCRRSFHSWRLGPLTVGHRHFFYLRFHRVSPSRELHR